MFKSSNESDDTRKPLLSLKSELLALSRIPWEEPKSMWGLPPWAKDAKEFQEGSNARGFGGRGRKPAGSEVGREAGREAGRESWLPVYADEDAPMQRPIELTSVAHGDFNEIRTKERKLIQKVRRWWDRLQERVRRNLSDSATSLMRPLSEKERIYEPEIGENGRKRKRITPSNYSAMEIHGFFGLIDDGRCSQGRMLICHVPSWVGAVSGCEGWRSGACVACVWKSRRGADSVEHREAQVLFSRT